MGLENVHESLAKSSEGYYFKFKQQLCSDQALAGAIGGGLTRFFCQPFDVLKIRFQVQIEPINKAHTSAVYHGILQGLQHIIRNEGWTALWKGHIAAQALSISFGFIQFGLFEAVTQFVFKNFPNLESFRAGVNFSTGLGTGCLATVVSFPFDTIRTRLIVQGEPKVYTGLTDVARKMWVKEGAFSLYYGLSPTLIQIGPYTGCQFAMYKFLVEIYDLHFDIKDHQDIATRSLACGAIAGATAKTFVYPLDLGKKRLQLHGFNQNHQYKGLIDCLRTTVKNEGYHALMKGLSPSLLKAFFSSALQFYFYELAVQYLSRRVDLTE